MADPPPSRKNWSLARAVRVAATGAASPQATPPGGAVAVEEHTIIEPDADLEEDEFDFRPFPLELPSKKAPVLSASGRRSSSATDSHPLPAASRSSAVSAAESEFGQNGIASGRGATSYLVDELRAGDKLRATYSANNAPDGRRGMQHRSEARQRSDSADSASSGTSEMQNLRAPPVCLASGNITPRFRSSLELPQGDACPSASSNVSEVLRGAAQPSPTSGAPLTNAPSASTSAPCRSTWQERGQNGPQEHGFPEADVHKGIHAQGHLGKVGIRRYWDKLSHETAAVGSSGGLSNASSGSSAGSRDNSTSGNASRKAETPKQKIARLQSENADLHVHLLSERSRAEKAEEALAALMEKMVALEVALAGGGGGSGHARQGAGDETLDDSLAQPRALLGRFNEEAVAERDAVVMELRERLRSFEQAAMEGRFDAAPESVGECAAQVDEVAELRSELQCLRRENTRMESQQQEVAKIHDWLQSTSPDTPVITPRGNGSISEIKPENSMGTPLSASFPAESFEIELTEEQRLLQDLTTIIEHDMDEQRVCDIQVGNAEAQQRSQKLGEVELRWSQELAELREARKVELQKHREEVQMEKEQLRHEIQASRDQRADLLQWELAELRDALLRVESDNERLQLESADLGNLQDDNRRLEVAELELLALRRDLQLMETERQGGSGTSGTAARVLSFETQAVATLHAHSATLQAECHELRTECKVSENKTAFSICEAGTSRTVANNSQGADESQGSWSLEERVRVLNAELQMQKDKSRSTPPRGRSRSVCTLPDFDPLQPRPNRMEKATQTNARVRSASQQRSEPGEPETAELQIKIGQQPAYSEREAAGFQRLVEELRDARQMSEVECAFDLSRHEAITEEVQQLRCEHQMLEDRLLELPRLQIALDKSQADTLRLVPLEEEVVRLTNAAIESKSAQDDLNHDLDKANIALDGMESRVEEFSRLEHEMDRLQMHQDQMAPLEAEVAILRHALQTRTEEQRVHRNSSSIDNEAAQLEAEVAALRHALQTRTEEQRVHRNSSSIDIDILAPLQQETAELQAALEQSQLACHKLEGNVQEFSVLHSEFDEVRTENLRLVSMDSKIHYFAKELEIAHVRMVKFAPLEQEVAVLDASRKESQSAHEATRGELQDFLALQPELERLQMESRRLAPLEEELVQLRCSAEESQSVHLRMDGFMQELSALQPMLDKLRLENLRLLPLEQKIADLHHALGESNVARDRMASVNQAIAEGEVNLRESLEATRNENQRLEKQEQELVELRYTMSSIQVDTTRLYPAENDGLEDVSRSSHDGLRARLEEEEQELSELRQATAKAVHAEFRTTQEELRQKTHEVEVQAQELAALRRSPRPNWSSPISAEEPSCGTLRSLQSLPRSPDASAGDGDCIEHPHQLVRQVLQSLDAMQASLPEDYAEELVPVGTRREDQAAVVALHIHIYMRKAESNRLSGTFMYLFV